MADLNALVSIKYLLAQIKNRLGCDDRTDEYFMQLIIDCLSELNMFHFKLLGTKPLYLTVNDINCVDLPVDYIDYMKIGYIANGTYIPLTLNQNIAIPVSEDCGLPTNPFKDVVSSVPEGFGVSGGYDKHAYYKIDKKNRRIIFSGRVPNDQVYIEYISAGVSIDSETAIPRQAVPAIRQYCIWQYKENDPTVAMNVKQRDGILYGQEVRRLNALENTLTPAEYIQAYREGFRQTVKR